jgi:hypothetical protein
MNALPARLLADSLEAPRRAVTLGTPAGSPTHVGQYKGLRSDSPPGGKHEGGRSDLRTGSPQRVTKFPYGVHIDAGFNAVLKA